MPLEGLKSLLLSGAKNKNNGLLALAGIITSLKIYFKASATRLE